MKIALLTNDQNSFFKFLAQGLQRMITSLGHDARIYYEGLDLLSYQYAFKPISESPLHFVSGNINRLIRQQQKLRYLKDLLSFDLLIVVANIPFGFLRSALKGIEEIRDLRPDLPIVQYSYIYLPLFGKGPLFQEYFGDGFKEKCFGLERYDHYLAVNLSTPQPLHGSGHPVTRIGCHLDDGSLYPEQDKFRALVDFPIKGKEAERAVQIKALENTNTEFLELNGQYSIDEIRNIYRRSSIYFIAFQESFGFPICELQACGSLVFSPYRSWLYSQSIKDDLSQPGFGRFTDNFKIYHNKLDELCVRILDARENHHPEKVRATFLEEQGYFFHGDQEALKIFLGKVSSGEINGQSHIENTSLNSKIDTQEYCEPPY